MSNLLTQISNIGIVPVVALEDSSKAIDLAKALVNGGIPTAEVTFRTAAALDTIELMCTHVPECIVGAGTVHKVDQAKEAVKAGAKFIVTPGFNPSVISWCKEQNIMVLPGCSSPSDLEKAMEMNLSVVKFFPAEVYGGIKTLKAFSGPYQSLKFMPTGGINEENLNDYLSLNNVVACGGSWMIPKSAIEANDFDKITDLCHKAVAKMFDFQLIHVGINTKDEEEASKVANTLSRLFLKPVTEYPSAYFAGDMFEIIKGSFLGEKGHIAILTSNIERAVDYFTRTGLHFNDDTKNLDKNGQLQTIYFKEEIAGFAVHLKRR